jgi:hypothetical protein
MVINKPIFVEMKGGKQYPVGCAMLNHVLTIFIEQKCAHFC